MFVTHDIDEAFLLGDQIVIFRPGGIVAQIGSPADILTNPADAFVASFVGADRGKRSLHLEGTPETPVVVDSEGRAAGVLTAGSHPLLIAEAVPRPGAGAPAQGAATS